MRILLVSDIHANQTALEDVLADAGSFDAVWNLGDAVGYGPDPVWCVNRLVEIGAQPSLAGNHDLACLGEIDISDFNPVAQIATHWTASQLGECERRYLRGLPPMTVVDGITLAHASPRAPVWEYVTDATVATEVFGHFTTQLCLVGHTHVASYAVLHPDSKRAEFLRLEANQRLTLGADRLIVNPGSVGQPRDHDPRAAFALLDLNAGTITARRVSYDVAAVQARMRAAGLPRPLISRIAAGR